MFSKSFLHVRSFTKSSTEGNLNRFFTFSNKKYIYFFCYWWKKTYSVDVCLREIYIDFRNSSNGIFKIPIVYIVNEKQHICQWFRNIFKNLCKCSWQLCSKKEFTRTQYPFYESNVEVSPSEKSAFEIFIFEKQICRKENCLY